MPHGNSVFVVLFIEKSVGSWGSAPDPDGRAYSAPPYPLAGQPAPSLGLSPASDLCPIPYIHVLSWFCHWYTVESTNNMLCTPPNTQPGYGPGTQTHLPPSHQCPHEAHKHSYPHHTTKASPITQPKRPPSHQTPSYNYPHYTRSVQHASTATHITPDALSTLPQLPT